MKTIIRHSRFDSNPFGDGGAKRSAQIEELLQRTEVNYSNDEFILPKGMSLIIRLLWFFVGARFVLRHFSWKEIRSVWNGIMMAKYFGLRIPLFDGYVDKDVAFLNEDTTSGAFGYPYMAKAIRKKMIAVPHNLESLCCPGADIQSGKFKLEWLSEDIKRLKMCDAVFCISKEETWLLQIHGVNAHYLPYYPPREAEDYLLRIRKMRELRTPNVVHKFLVLGSANNTPTREGMEEVLNYLCTFEKLPFEIHVGGYKTELLNKIDHPQFYYYGTLSKEALEKLLVEVDALIINQPATSGALTRIVEHLIAGIPVIASFGAARDYYMTHNVQVFYSLDALKGILDGFQPVVAEMPIRNEESEELFINNIKEIWKQDKG